ncbi:MAG TPA: triose-phosphate isomerase [Bacillota bacterium]|nr:triose-phosphate isomerase [Bacillota bacterium]
MRRPLIVGNWKLHCTVVQAIALADAIRRAVGDPGSREVAIAPPFTAIYAVRGVICGTPIGLAAQDAHWEERGAFTGAVSPGLLHDVGCRYAILGHSERREHFAETDAAVARKLRAVLAAGLSAVLCVGERAAERDQGRAQAVVAGQLAAALAGIAPETLPMVAIAYEPVWAIGTGLAAGADEAAAMADYIRGRLAAGWGDAAGRARILYGGSVNPGNAGDFLRREAIDGALVGGASLNADSFAAIVKAAP